METDNVGRCIHDGPEQFPPLIESFELANLTLILGILRRECYDTLTVQKYYIARSVQVYPLQPGWCITIHVISLNAHHWLALYCAGLRPTIAVTV